MSSLLQPGMEKEAGSIAKTLGWGALKSVHDWTFKGTGAGLKWLSRRFASPEMKQTMGRFDPVTGKWRAHLVNNPTSWRHHLQNYGMKMDDVASRFINNKFNTHLNAVGAEHGDLAKKILKWTPAATTGYFLGGEMLLDGKNPLSWPAHAAGTAWQWMTPMGLGTQAVFSGLGNVAKKYGKTVAMQTADQMAAGIQEQGRMGHLYGLWSPQDFSNKLREKAFGQINNIFG